MATFTVTTADDELDNIDTLGTISIANFGGLNDISLREAIALAQDALGDDEIDFDVALAGDTLVLTLGELQITGNGSLTVNGDTDGDGKANITISGNDDSRIFSANIAGETLSLESLTLTEGNSNFAGGAVYAASTMTVEVLNSTISNSQSGNSGGAIFGGYLEIANSTIVGNSAGNRGGGIAVFPAGVGTNTSAIITNTTIHGNYANSIGGGIYGGGGSTLTINSSTITENESNANGGAIGAFVGSTLTIRNSVLADNTVPLGGEIIAELGGYSAITAGNSFFDDNLFNSGVDTDEGGNTFTVGADPGLDPLADNGGVVETQAIQDGSPLLEAGSETLLPTEAEAGLDVDGDGVISNDPIDVDARGEGFPRDVDFNGVPPTPDIGAFEKQIGAAEFIVTTRLDEDFGGGSLIDEMTDGDGLSLREALGLANLDGTTLDIINFDPTVFSGGLNSFIRLDAALGTLDVEGSVTINGGTGTDIIVTGDTIGNDVLFGGTLLTNAINNLNTADNVRVFDIDNDNDGNVLDVTIDGLSITGGFDQEQGGGIYSRENLTLTNSTVFGNEVQGLPGGAQGGGISSHLGSLTITDSTIASNQARMFGEGSALGGGIYHSSTGALTIIDTVVIDNSVVDSGDGDGSGGGIFLFGDEVTIQNSTIEDNDVSSDSVSTGGGIYGTANSFTIENSEFINNRALVNDLPDTTAVGGGAKLVVNDTLSIDKTTFDDNYAGGGNGAFGGGLNIYGQGISTDHSITNSTISNNGVAGSGPSYGAGIYSRINNNTAPLEISNSTISGNNAGQGGGIFKYAGGLEISNSTITDNAAADGNTYGSGVYTYFGTTTVTSSIIAGNDSSDVDGLAASFVSGGNNLIGNGDGSSGAFQNGVNGDIVGSLGTEVDPLLGDLADNGGPTETHLPEAGSPALNAGDNPDGLTEDQRGIDRTSGTIDIGSVEVQAAGNFVVTTNLDEAFDGGDLAAEMADGDGLSLREALGLANIAAESADIIQFDGTEFTGGADSVIRLDGALGELINSGIVTIDGRSGTDVVITGDTVGNDALVGGSYITDVDASGGDLADNIRVLNIIGKDSATTLHSLTITGGRTMAEGPDSAALGADGNGGGIRTNAQLSIFGSTISGNSTAGEEANGGGIGNSQFDANGYINSDDVQIYINGSTISGNRSADDGGGIHSYDGNITIIDSSITGNTVSGSNADGGGIHTVGGTVILSNSELSDNHVVVGSGTSESVDAEGGGIHNSGGDIFVTGSIISGNSVTVDGQTTNGKIDAEGGAIRTNSGDLFITNSSITGNFVRVENSTVGTNLDVEGGGIRGHYGTINIVNSTIAGNAALADGNTVTDSTDIEGGGLRTNYGNVSITNTTITGNYSSGQGGGVFMKKDGGIGTFTFGNSIILGNGAGEGFPFNEFSLNGSNVYDSAPTIIGSNLYDGMGLVNSTVLPGTIADIAQSVFNQTIDFVDLNGNGTQQADEPSLGADIEGGLSGIYGGLNGPSAILALNPLNPALDAGEDAVSINTVLDEAAIGVDMNGDEDTNDVLDDIGDFAFDQRGDGFDRLLDQPAVANNGGNFIDLGAVEVQVPIMNRSPVELALIDADTDQVITIIRNGDDIPLALVQGRDVTLSATVPATSRFFGQVESMFLDFNNGDATRGETVEPYALFGDDTNGDFFGGTMLQLGGQTLSLDLFSDDARNNLLETVEFNFNVVDGPNEDPEIVSANANSVDENQTFAIDVQSIDDSDSEGSGLTYSITEGIDADEFDIDPNTGVLTFKNAPDFENPTDDNLDNIYNVQVTVTDSQGEEDSQIINITVEDVDESVRPLVELALIDTDTDQVITTIMDGDAIPLALVQGRNVSLSATVPNTSPLFGQVESMFLDFNNGDVTRGETVEPYALFGDDTAGDFFGGTMLGLGGQTISLDLFSDDARNNLLDTVDFDFTIVDGPNEDPEIVSPNANTVNENQSFAINVQSNDDRDSEGNGLTYSIIGGDDGGLFSIDEDTGVLTFNDAPDFENPTDDNTDNIYNVEVEVEDSGGLTDTQTIDITVEDVDETPQAIAEIGIYDTDTNALITLIQDGDVFPVGLFNGNEDDLTIGVVIPNTSPLFGQVESVFLDLNDGQVTRTEDAEIYALSGDVNGDLFDGRDLTGDNTIELEFYSSDQRRGDLLETLEIDFTIDDSIIT